MLGYGGEQVTGMPYTHAAGQILAVRSPSLCFCTLLTVRLRGNAGVRHSPRAQADEDSVLWGKHFPPTFSLSNSSSEMRYQQARRC
jgi:hypothetical protein